MTIISKEAAEFRHTEYLAQDLFDTVADHLLTQNQQSLSKGDVTCLYRNKEGLSCAIGRLIPENKYTIEFDKAGCVATLHRLFTDKQIGFNLTEHRSLCASLQGVHDHYSPKNWRDNLNRVCKEYDLLPYPRPESDRSIDDNTSQDLKLSFVLLD